MMSICNLTNLVYVYNCVYKREQVFNVTTHQDRRFCLIFLPVIFCTVLNRVTVPMYTYRNPINVYNKSLKQIRPT